MRQTNTKPHCHRRGCDNQDLVRQGTYKLKDGTARQQHLCHEHHAEKQRRYRRSPNGLASYRRSTRKYEAANPLRRRAWDAARKIPAVICEWDPAGTPCSKSTRLHRHHDDVTKPLDVMVLCPAHHRERHRQLKALAGATA